MDLEIEPHCVAATGRHLARGKPGLTAFPHTWRFSGFELPCTSIVCGNNLEPGFLFAKKLAAASTSNP